MESISQRQMRNASGSILRRVEAGESFVITNRGVEVARLVPFRSRSSVDREALISSGVLLPRRLGSLELPPLVDTQVDVDAALEDLRADR